jgi:hypothetical protein
MRITLRKLGLRNKSDWIIPKRAATRKEICKAAGCQKEKRNMVEGRR